MLVGCVQMDKEVTSTTTPATTSAVTPDKAPVATVTIPKDQTAGLSKITSLDGERIEFDNKLEVTPGEHVLGVACSLENGVGLSFTMNIDFEAELYYCVKAVDPGKTCAVAYVKSTTIEAANQACLTLKKE